MDAILDPIRNTVKDGMKTIAQFINSVSKGRITPNMVTYTGLVAHVGIAWLIAYRYFTMAGLLLIVFGLFDTLDGALARVQGSVSKGGMLLDSITDRMKEVFLYAGVAYALVVTGNPRFAVWAVLACGFSIVVSYVNAWGEAVTKDDKKPKHTTNRTYRVAVFGFMSFEVRMFVLIFGLFTGYIKQAVMFIAIFALITALERFYLVTKSVND